MADRQFEIGDTVKHIDQDIIGEILRIHYDTNEIVIKDLGSEYESPEDELIYRPEDLELYKNQIGG